MSYFYSAINNCAYAGELYEDYILAKNWPADAKEISISDYNEYFIQPPPQGKERTANKNGLLSWTDLPELSKDDLIKTAEFELQRYRTKANDYITPLQDAVDLGIATDNELAKLKCWKEYRVALNRLDINQAPDIEWPKSPDV